MTLVVAAAIIRDGRVLAAQRSYPDHLRGYWEFPGGKVEPGETAAQALTRECTEELRVTVEVGPAIGEDVPIRRFDQGTRLRLFRCQLGQSSATPGASAAHDQLRWLGPDDLDSVLWLVTNRQLLPRVARILSVAA